MCISVTYGHFHYAAATSGFNSVELIDNIVGGYAYEIDFRVHYSSYSTGWAGGREKLFEDKTLGNVCLPSIGQN